MKIGEYEQMMAYLTRSGFKDGTEKIVEPPKSMQMDTTTSNPIPDYDINDFRNDAEIFVLAYHNNTLPRADIADKLNAFAKKGIDAGTFTEQDAGDMVQRLIGEVKDRAQKQRLRDVVPEGIGRKEFAKGTGGRPRADVPGLEDEVKKLFDQGLSTNQVLKNLKEKPEFEKVTEGVVKRIKKEFNLGVKQADVLTSQADKYNKLKELIEQSNNQLKFVDLRTLRERANLPRKAASTDIANMEKFNVPKLDSAADKVRKGFQKIIRNPNVPVEEVFDISTKIAKDTNLSPASVSQFLQDIPEYQDFKPTALKLQSPSFKGLIAGQDRTLADVMDMANQTPKTTGTSLTGPNTPERFIINSVKRHIAQNGDKVEWVKAPGTFDELGKVTEGRSVFRYKGKDYSYLDLVQKGRNMKEFKEVYEMYEDMDKLLSREVVNPVTNEKTTFKNLMNEAYAKGTGYETIKNPLEIDHFGSVKKEPFSNLRILPYRINRAAGTITKNARDAEKGFVTKQADKWTPAKSKMYLQKSGYNFTKNPEKLFKDEIKLANDILVKGRKLRTPVDIGVEAANKKFKGLLNLKGITTADKIERPDKAKTRDMFKDFEIRTNQLGSNLGLLKGVGETLKAVPTPTGTLALTAGFGVDPTSTIDRVALEAEAALAPELVKQTSKLTSNPIVQRFFNLGLSPTNAMRVARVAQPLGVASLIGEGLYELGKRGVAEKEKLDAMTPFQKQQYLAGEVEPLMDEGGMVDISRDGFDEGGPSDPSKRKFMKILGGLATLPVFGKFFKVADKAAPAVSKAIEGMPDFITDLIKKVKTKAEATGMKYFTGNRADEFADVYQADDYVITEKGNNITIRKTDDPDNPNFKEIEMEIETDPETGGMTYKEATARPDADGKLKDIEEYVDDIDLEDMKKYTYDE